MRAVVFERPGEAACREVETPVAGPGEVLVRSLRAGVCRTDLEILAGELDPRFVRFPVVPGHEWSGEVAELGPGVDDLAPGERVQAIGTVSYTTGSWARLLRLLAARFVELDPLVTHRFPLERFEEAFRLLGDDGRGAVVKIVLEP